MTFDVIATGSTGNAVVINGSILIDCENPPPREGGGKSRV